MGCDVFISHSSVDAATANAVVHVLESNGVRCWIAPRDIQPGANYMGSITEAIRSAKLVVLVFSPSANASAHVNREVQQAAELNLPIIPLKIEQAEPSDSLAYALVGRHWLDAMKPPMEDNLRQLTRAVLSLLGDTSEPSREINVPSTWTKTERSPALPASKGPALDAYGLPIREVRQENPPRVWPWVLSGLALGLLTPVPYIAAAVRRPRSGWLPAAVLMTLATLGVFAGMGNESLADNGAFTAVAMSYIFGSPFFNWWAGRKWREQWWQRIEQRRAELADDGDAVAVTDAWTAHPAEPKAAPTSSPQARATPSPAEPNRPDALRPDVAASSNNNRVRTSTKTWDKPVMREAANAQRF